MAAAFIGAAMSEKSAVDFSDIQGIARFAYAHLPEACFYLLRVENAAAARGWLRSLEVTTAERLAARPKTALQIAFTSDGLRALGMADELVRKFSQEFFAGMAGEESRSRRLGDEGLSAPEEWQWGVPAAMPHILVMLYAENGGLHALKDQVATRFPSAGLSIVKCLEDSVSDGYEPFGFADGISQPKLDWERERKTDSGDRLEYENTLALGEFLLGYPNEYSRYTDRPLLDAREDPWAELARAEDQPVMRDLGLNGAYLVLRQLHQNAHRFWAYLDHVAHGNALERKKIAEAMVGRTLEGNPLAPPSREPISGVERPKDVASNQFTYEADAFGERCPVGAHVRRANPRNADLPGKPKGILARLLRILGFKSAHIAEDLVAATRFHRILRRGRKYGTTLQADEAIGNPNADRQERGIYFIGLVANIGRQFEFVQNAWMMGHKFAGFTAESDPLLGNRAAVPGCPATDGFSIPQANGVNHRITGLPQFVTIRGGAYFFLPSLRALRYLSRLGS
jgi:deferrochelatase/peroxidase EfeB